MDESGYDLIHFKDSISGQQIFDRLEFYLTEENNTIVGLTGIYASNNRECWLGWFGICPEHRHKGYATQLLDLTLKMMRNYGYKMCCLYTDTINNQHAIQLYLKKGFQIDSTYQGNIITMVKSLDEKTQIVPWHGKPLGFVPEWPIDS